MKIFAATLIAAATADDKKVPPKHPLQRLATLQRFAYEWCDDNLNPKQAAHWTKKFENNTERFRARFDLCPFYDESLEHGGPAGSERKRRSFDDGLCDEDGICRYDKLNPIVGIKQITTGFRKWAQRYIADCKLQPGRQVDRANYWFNKLGAKLQANQQ